MKKERDSFLVCLCCLFLTVCYSDHQGQASAKRQGKFKKVLDELETLYNRASTALLPSGNDLFLTLRWAFVYICINDVKACQCRCVEISNSLVTIGIYVDVQFYVFWWSVK